MQPYQYDSEQESKHERRISEFSQKLQAQERNKFYKFMLNVEKTIYYLQDQISQGSIFIEDILNLLFCDQDSNEESENVETTILRYENQARKQRQSKINHKFVAFKNYEKFHKGNICPICTNQAFIEQTNSQSSFENGNEFGQLIPKLTDNKYNSVGVFRSKLDQQRYSKILDMARFKRISNQIEQKQSSNSFIHRLFNFGYKQEDKSMIKVQFYGENHIIFHNQKMMKKLIKQEIMLYNNDDQSINNPKRNSLSNTGKFSQSPIGQKEVNDGKNEQVMKENNNIIKRLSLDGDDQRYSYTNDIQKDEYTQMNKDDRIDKDLILNTSFVENNQQDQNESMPHPMDEYCNQSILSPIGQVQETNPNVIDIEQNGGKLQSHDNSMQYEHQLASSPPRFSDYVDDHNNSGKKPKLIINQSLKDKAIPVDNLNINSHFATPLETQQDVHNFADFNDYNGNNNQSDSNKPVTLNFTQDPVKAVNKRYQKNQVNNQQINSDIKNTYNNCNDQIYNELIKNKPYDQPSSISVSYRADQAGGIFKPLSNFSESGQRERIRGQSNEPSVKGFELICNDPTFNQPNEPTDFNETIKLAENRQGDLQQENINNENEKQDIKMNNQNQLKLQNDKQVGMVQINRILNSPAPTKQLNKHIPESPNNENLEQQNTIEFIQNKLMNNAQYDNTISKRSQRSHGLVSIDQNDNKNTNLMSNNNQFYNGEFKTIDVDNLANHDNQQQLLFKIQSNSQSPNNTLENEEVLGTYKDSQYFVEFTEIFGDNENCDICGEPFEKHGRDYNFEAFERIDKVKEILNQTVANNLTLNNSAHNISQHQQSLTQIKKKAENLTINHDDGGYQYGRFISFQKMDNSYSGAKKSPAPHNTGYKSPLNDAIEQIIGSNNNNTQGLTPKIISKNSRNQTLDCNYPLDTKSRFKEQNENRSEQMSIISDSKRSCLIRKNKINMEQIEQLKQIKMSGGGSSARFKEELQDKNNYFYEPIGLIPNQQNINHMNLQNPGNINRSKSTFCTTNQIVQLNNQRTNEVSYHLYGPLDKLQKYFQNQNLCKICYNQEIEGLGNFCNQCCQKMCEIYEAQEIGYIQDQGENEQVAENNCGSTETQCKNCGLKNHMNQHLQMPEKVQQKHIRGSSTPLHTDKLLNQNKEENVGSQCENHIRSLYNKMKLKQIRHLYENDPLQILQQEQNFQFCINCDRVLKKYNQIRCQHLTCQHCKITFCMYCREVIYEYSITSKKPVNMINKFRDHFNPFSLNSCKMSISTKNYSNYREQIRIRENIQHALDTNYLYTTEANDKEAQLKRNHADFLPNSDRGIRDMNNKLQEPNQSHGRDLINITQYLLAQQANIHNEFNENKNYQKDIYDDNFGKFFLINQNLMASCCFRIIMLIVWLLLGIIIAQAYFLVVGFLNLYNRLFQFEKVLYYDQKEIQLLKKIMNIGQFIFMGAALLALSPIACICIYIIGFVIIFQISRRSN